MNTVRDWITGHALLIAAVFALLMATFAAVQTVRLDGLQFRLPLIGQIGPEGWIARAQRAEREKLAIMAAQAEAELQQLAENARLERESEKLAQEIDDAKDQLQRTQLELARRFIAAGGVRPKGAGGAPSTTNPTPESIRAGDGDGAGSLPLVDDLPGVVAVYASDVEICTINTSRLLKAHEWGLELEGR